jgi:hypothetical protein
VISGIATRLSLALLLLSGAVTFAPVVRKLLYDWWNDDNYSHGFFIVPLALYFAWERRERLASAVIRPSAFGFVVVAGSLSVLVAGTLGAEFFLTRVALIGVLAGTVLFLLGWEHLRILALPLSFLLLMIPLPSIIFNQIAFPLQLFASKFGTITLQALAVPVLREGNVIELANTKLQVAEACSGIRSLISPILEPGCESSSRFPRFRLRSSPTDCEWRGRGLRPTTTGRRRQKVFSIRFPVGSCFSWLSSYCSPSAP